MTSKAPLAPPLLAHKYFRQKGAQRPCTLQLQGWLYSQKCPSNFFISLACFHLALCCKVTWMFSGPQGPAQSCAAHKVRGSLAKAGSGVKNAGCSALLQRNTFSSVRSELLISHDFVPAWVGDSFFRYMIAKGVPCLCSTVSLQPLESWHPAWLAKQESWPCSRNPRALSHRARLVSHDPE